MAADKAGSTAPRWLIWAAVAFGLMIGAVSRYVRPMIPGPVHYESIVGGILLVLFAVVVARTCARANGAHGAHGAHGADSAAAVTVVATLAVWIAYAIGWSIVARRIWSDILVAATLGAGFSLVVALTFSAVLRRTTRS